MSERKYVQRKDRNLQFTIDQLFDSVRFKLAVEFFDKDPMLLRALITEICLETMNVVRSTLVKTYNNHNSLTAQNMIPLLRSVNEFNTYNIYFSLSPAELKLYAEDPKGLLSTEERYELLTKIHHQLMESNQSAKNE